MCACNRTKTQSKQLEARIWNYRYHTSTTKGEESDKTLLHVTREGQVSSLYLKKLVYVAKGQGMTFLINVSVAAGYRGTTKTTDPGNSDSWEDNRVKKVAKVWRFVKTEV